MYRRIVATALMLTLAACASGGASGGASASAKPQESRSRDRNIISASEIESLNETNLHRVIQTLRPNMLVPRGTTSAMTRDAGIVVFLDDRRFGDVESLKSLSPANVTQIRYLSASEAQSRWGSDYNRGVILVTTKGKSK